MTLTEFSYQIRKFGPFAVLGFVLFLIFFAIFQFVFTTARSRKPPSQPVFDIAFGPLDQIEVENNVNYPQDAKFVIDNIEGRPTTTTDSARIYFLPSANTRFGYLQTITLMAQAVGFDTRFVSHELEDAQAIFEDDTKKLSVNIKSFNFEFKTNFEENPSIFDDPDIPAEQAVVETARNFLRRMNRYPDKLAQGPTSVVYLRYDETIEDFEKVETANEANVVEVDFFRPDTDGLPMVPPKYFNSQNFVVIVFQKNGNKVIKAQVKFFRKDDETVGKYPIKTGDAAWDELVAGKALIVSSGQNTNNITIREMFLAYLDPATYQRFLQPVYVFLGDNGFVAYVQAVLDKHIATQEAGFQ